MTQEGWSPLLLAAEMGRAEAVKLLLDNKASLKMHDEVKEFCFACVMVMFYTSAV